MTFMSLGSQGREIPGYLPSLIQVASKATIPKEERLQAAIAVKDCVVNLWGPHKSVKPHSPDMDKVRGHLLPAALTVAEIPIVRLLGRAVAEIFLYDYQNVASANDFPK